MFKTGDTLAAMVRNGVEKSVAMSQAYRLNAVRFQRGIKENI